MPLYDFACRHCGNHFEALVRSGTKPTCQSCGSEDLEQLVSSFGVSSASTHNANVAKARKTAEKTRAEKRHAEHQYMHKHLHDDH
jgi:putative FmdB family regulatory protein